MTPSTAKAPFESWDEAVGLVHRWLEQSERLDELMDRVSALAVGVERARVQHLVYGVFRHHLRLKSRISAKVNRAPRFRVQAILYVASYELIEALESGGADEGLVAKVVHHAVERAKKLVAFPEVRLLNAVLRKIAAELASEKAPAALSPSAVLADYFSHPEWLVRRWQAQFGAVSTRFLLEWNLKPAPVYVRWRSKTEQPPAWLLPTKWENFYTPEPRRWSEVEDFVSGGQLYVQDPSTRLAVDLLAPQKGETVLDLCAAPGGKSLMAADRMEEGTLVAVDLPGQRQDRLQQNLGRVAGVTSHIVLSDVAGALPKALQDKHLPPQYAAVLLDSPCSNTGVMRHRIDVKERLQESDIPKHARQQGELLLAAARLVAPGGRLVYSTCSIDPDENEGVISDFLKKRGAEYSLEEKAVSYPWESGHDGAAVFRLRRSSKL
jgi:16S rRNA (cytosine967-C5)-methyltransferase